MKLNRWISLVIILSCPVAAALAQTPAPAEAHWSGAIQAVREIEMTVDLARGADGKWAGSLSMPFFGQVDVPIENILIEGAVVRFGAAGSTYQARVSEDGGEFSGTVESAIGNAPFKLKKSGAANVKVPPPSTPLSKDASGAWEGVLKAANREIRFKMQLANGPGGLGAGSVTALPENQVFPITTVTQSGRNLQLDIRGAARMSFSGSLNEAGSELSGSWTEGNNTMPVTMRRSVPAVE